MGCGASTKKGGAALTGTPGERKELREFLKGIGVRQEDRTANALEKCGVFKRTDLTMLDAKLQDEVDESLKASGVTIGDRGKVKNCTGQEVVVKNSTGSYTPVVMLQPGQAIQAAKKLERVYLGIGWTNRKVGGTVDVDASIISYGKGEVVEQVSFTNLRNDTKSVVHTGDILIGASDADKKKVEDLERIYVWLSKVPGNVDCLSLVANIYSGAADFSELKEAYVRLVNADTNQEISRMRLAGDGLRGNALVFAKIYRVGTVWQVFGIGMPLNISGSSKVDSIYPAMQDNGCNWPPPAALTQSTASESRPEKAKKQKPSAVLPCVALAAATVGGIAAATAIFLYVDRDALAGASFLPDVFEAGVDFSALECIPDALEGAADLLPIDQVGEVFSWAGSVVADVDVGAFGEAAGGALLSSGEAVLEGLGAAADAGAGVVGGIDFGAAAEGIGDFFSNAAGAIGDAAGGIGQAAGGLAEGAGDLLGGLAKALE